MDDALLALIWIAFLCMLVLVGGIIRVSWLVANGATVREAIRRIDE